MTDDTIDIDGGHTAGEVTPWQVWLHPVRSAEKIRTFDKTVERMEREHDVTRGECARLAQENERLRGMLAESENARAGLESLLAQMRDEEEFQREMEERMTLLEKEMEKAEEMKRRYEARIETLRRRVADANAELRRISGQAKSGEAVIDIETLIAEDLESAGKTPAESSASGNREAESDKAQQIILSGDTRDIEDEIGGVDASGSGKKERSFRGPRPAPSSQYPPGEWLRPLPDKI